ncbi:MAG TPA: ferredoxin [Solirubrobacteraceae bacterium]|jgi:ferredoxin|nr:ferredoxin [Solirubrobacteraceae bacterium]
MRLDVDPIKCEAHGLCAELLPERITLDEWGYPIIDPAPIPASLQDLARRTVNACPTLALKLRALESRPLDGVQTRSRRVVSGRDGGEAAPGRRARSTR